MKEKIRIEPLSEAHTDAIVNWCKDRDGDFLRQWAGDGYTYPLDREQIRERLKKGAEIYEVYVGEKMVATIEITERDDEICWARVGRYLLDQSLAGKGLGTEIMLCFLQYCKEKLGIKEVSLWVFDFNIGGYKCYQKCGFVEDGFKVRANGWKAINMRKVL